jgi:YD repeat-containing protein
VTWSYDDTYQLTRDHRSGTAAYDTTNVYDPVGNRLVKIAGGARTTSTFDAANQLETSVDASGATTYTFDADGNQRVTEEPLGDRTTHMWGYENKNTLTLLPDGSRMTMAYNPDGIRVRKMT